MYKTLEEIFLRLALTVFKNPLKNNNNYNFDVNLPHNKNS